MLLHFSVYTFYYLSFVQLIVSTVLVLSPARGLGTRYRWTGSRITEVFVGTLGAVVVSAVSCWLTHEVWGLPYAGLESCAFVLVIVSAVVMTIQSNINFIGQVFYASFLAASLTFLVYAAYIAVLATHSILETITSFLVILLDAAAFFVWMSNINYSSDVLCRARRGRPLPQADPGHQPFVSLHVPAYNEPPELLIQTIQALERLDYPNYEVVVIDNNTKDPAVWEPVAAYCEGRERVRFVHVAPWPGYKAGACNLVLRRYTDPRAEIIGLVDADDIVQPYYLREVAPYFSDPSIGFVQTFEGNRDFQGSHYYQACVDSFQGFYLTVMSSRNERNTVPFVGTMGLFRRDALVAAGGWNEWCICEDTEASLRVTRDGWSGLYIPRCFGRGVVPPSFRGMLVQRHRWCFGAMQILRLHWKSLMPWDSSPTNHMTSAQRRDFLMASLGWFRDLLMFAFSALLLVISALLVTQAHFTVSPVDGSRSVFPMSLIIVATIANIFAMRLWTTMSFRRAVLSFVISLSVSWVIALGCIEGSIRRDAVFLRTSKAAGGKRRIGAALRLSKVEGGMAVALFAAVGFLSALRDVPWILVFIIFIQATVYVCGPIASVWNLWAQGTPDIEYRRRFQERQLREKRRQRPLAWLPRPALGATVAALGVGGVAGVLFLPVPLLSATTASTTAATQSLASSSGTEVYLRLGSAATGAQPAYYPITSVHLATGRKGDLRLSFRTSSLVLLGDVLHDAADGGRVSHVSLAFRALGLRGELTTESLNTFRSASVTSFRERLTGAPGGTVSLTLTSAATVVSAPSALKRAGPFARPSGTRTARASALTPAATAPAALSAVQVSQKATSGPISLRFTTASIPLLNEMFRSQGSGTGLEDLTLSVGTGKHTGLKYTFSTLRVGSFAEESRSGALSGTATLSTRR